MEADLIRTKWPGLAMIFALVTGVVCHLGGRSGLKGDISTSMLVDMAVNRILIGFVIGISDLRLQWALHGAATGFLVGLPFITGCLSEVETVVAALVLGVLHEFIIELFTSVVFGARARQRGAPAYTRMAALSGIECATHPLVA